MTPLRALGLGGALVATLFALSLAVFSAHRGVAHPPVLRGTPVEPPKTAVNFNLTAADGRPARLIEPAYATTFLFFGYTHCPDACPLAMASLGRAYRSLSPLQAARTRVVFITVDPARDTPAVLKRYVGAFGGHFVGLTGSPEALRRVWQAYGVSVEVRSREIGHGDVISAIDRNGTVLLVYPPNVDAADLASDAAALASVP